ncbi:MAG: DUF2970 domain-containing protein [Gammaproteobacteria bacterium]|nr:DUF2970 domain-containing protein [Gammaproteobacteria bacterium]NIR85352.1 DUF2970 domain-containing protein [Gammaproteobacteria bacterium]NIR88812.1 DUF2970 domain-containing protein [Gammaproteobacteria bacterium]NIT68544.1 DUF2970 domain-containing protein [Gemmatimonadota bacterium]NIY37121.1 DUF2970 domain-containing protein [Gemmatimonadota bacterium]
MQTEHERPGILQVLGSVLAAMFGVQSARRHERDFSAGRPAHYVLAGVLMTVALVLAVWGVVQLVLHAAGV